MDDGTFDRLSRSIIASPTRRGAMRLVTGSALASLLGASLGADVSARKKKKKK